MYVWTRYTNLIYLSSDTYLQWKLFPNSKICENFTRWFIISGDEQGSHNNFKKQYIY